MESYHDYLEHARSHKYIRKERTSSGKWRYYYPEDVEKHEVPRRSKKIGVRLQNKKHKDPNAESKLDKVIEDASLTIN